MCFNEKHKKIHAIYILFLFLLTMVVVFFIAQNHFYHTKVIAISWSDNAFDINHKYKLCVYFENGVNGEVQIKAKIDSGVNDFFSHDIGVIGISRSNIDDVDFPDVVEQWGDVKWKSDGVYIGSDAKSMFFITKKTLETL